MSAQASVSEQAVAVLAEALAHFPVGSGYYQSSVATDEAREMAQWCVKELAEAGITLSRA